MYFWRSAYRIKSNKTTTFCLMYRMRLKRYTMKTAISHKLQCFKVDILRVFGMFVCIYFIEML